MKLSRYCITALITFFLSNPAFAQLSLSPEKVDVNDAEQPRNVLITFDGNPVLPDEILKIVSGVTKTGDALPDGAAGNTHFSNYSYMFSFETSNDGIITITPNDGLVELGKYDLHVHTVHGKITGLINANLRDSVPPLQHQRTNLSEFKYDITLPDFVYGQLISIDLKPDNKNTYTWYVDGEVHSSGVGETSFRGWPEPGTHEISYVALSPEGVLLSRWSDTTNISKEEPISSTVRKGYKVPFSAPGGYSRVTWTLDGKQIADNHPEPSVRDTQYVTFRKKGKHTLTCLARDSESGNFRHLKWSVNVK